MSRSITSAAASLTACFPGFPPAACAWPWIRPGAAPLPSAGTSSTPGSRRRRRRHRLVNGGRARHLRLVDLGADDPALAEKDPTRLARALAQQDPVLAFHLEDDQHARQCDLV